MKARRPRSSSAPAGARRPLWASRTRAELLRRSIARPGDRKTNRSARPLMRSCARRNRGEDVDALLSGPGADSGSSVLGCTCSYDVSCCAQRRSIECLLGTRRPKVSRLGCGEHVVPALVVTTQELSTVAGTTQQLPDVSITALTPRPSSPAVSARMSAASRTDTRPEQELRSELHRRGFRFRLQRPLPFDRRRRADIVFPRERVAVFVDGCFWHACPEHGTWPKANAEWWRDKLTRNRQRDADTDNRLAASGWLSVRVWEHEDVVAAAERVAAVVCARRGATPVRRGGQAPTCSR